MWGMSRRIALAVAVVIIILTIGDKAMAFEIKSKAFGNENTIPSKYTCDGTDFSPPLSWSDPPAGTKSYALIADDPDAPAGTWVHWVVWNIPAGTSNLKEAMDKAPKFADGTRQGINDFKRVGYGGPCPPSGTHRYYFKLYALDTILDIPVDTTKATLEAAMKGHILGQATLLGTYSRSH
jgi:Raf kinase inhibitor-like YbhB/YbcL family protein